jgi:hypothetical protein
MKCRDCDEANEEGYRYCFNCGAYLAVKPGPAHWDLLQLSRMDFLTTVAEGLPLIWENSARLWRESVDLRQLGPSQSVGILQSFAEEEAAKVLILLDAVRCPASSKNEFGRLVKQLDQHVGKGIYELLAVGATMGLDSAGRRSFTTAFCASRLAGVTAYV